MAVYVKVFLNVIMSLVFLGATSNSKPCNQLSIMENLRIRMSFFLKNAGLEFLGYLDRMFLRNDPSHWSLF